MSRKIIISICNFEAEAIPLEEKDPKTCEEIWKALPIEGRAKIYKEEVYFEIPVKIEPEETTPETRQGDVSYWPGGSGFCVFFGDSQPVSPVSTFARVEEGIEKFRDVEGGDEIKVCKVE